MSGVHGEADAGLWTAVPCAGLVVRRAGAGVAVAVESSVAEAEALADALALALAVAVVSVLSVLSVVLVPVTMREAIMPSSSCCRRWQWSMYI